MDRRGFNKIVSRIGISVIISGVIQSCSQWLPQSRSAVSRITVSPTTAAETTAPESQGVQPSPTQQMTESPARSQVAFVKTEDRVAGVRQALELLDVEPFTGDSVFLKPNYNSADPAPGSTHNDVLSTLVAELQRSGAGRIIVGDRSGMGDTRAVMQSKDIFRMADELGFETVVFDDLSEEDWVGIPSDGSHWNRGFAFARPILEADRIVQACCLKTHRYGGHFTLSLKNSVGMVAKRVPGENYNYMNELHGSSHQRRMIAEINSAYQPDLVVLDGVEAFVTGGPDSGKRVRSNVVLAGTDRVAIDALGVAILRYYGTTPEVAGGAVFDLEQIARAVELDLGARGPEEIEVVTGDPGSAVYAEEILQLI